MNGTGGAAFTAAVRQAYRKAHFISRAKSGRGIEENVLTLCRRCHDVFDNGAAMQRQEMRAYFAWYLNEKYPDWNEADLVYRKGI